MRQLTNYSDSAAASAISKLPMRQLTGLAAVTPRSLFSKLPMRQLTQTKFYNTGK